MLHKNGKENLENFLLLLTQQMLIFNHRNENTREKGEK